MRIYLPATFAELPTVEVRSDGQASMTISPRRAHAVTSSLELAHPEEDSEGLEYVALLAAADADLELLAGSPHGVQLRVVLTLEVPDDAVTTAGPDVAVLEPSAVDVTREVIGAVVVCVHVDEPEAGHDVAAMLAGDDDAAERLVERDLLWYDTTEFADIPTA